MEHALVVPGGLASRLVRYPTSGPTTGLPGGSDALTHREGPGEQVASTRGWRPAPPKP
jgi:hypothetical protein